MSDKNNQRNGGDSSSYYRDIAIVCFAGIATLAVISTCTYVIYSTNSGQEEEENLQRRLEL